MVKLVQVGLTRKMSQLESISARMLPSDQMLMDLEEPLELSMISLTCDHTPSEVNEIILRANNLGQAKILDLKVAGDADNQIGGLRASVAHFR